MLYSLFFRLYFDFLNGCLLALVFVYGHCFYLLYVGLMRFSYFIIVVSGGCFTFLFRAII